MDIQAPYVPGTPDPINAMGDADAGGRDTVASDVAQAQANAEARFREHESDTYDQGSQIGDALTLPQSNLSPAVGVQMPGEAMPSGSYYDPPREY